MMKCISLLFGILLMTTGVMHAQDTLKVKNGIVIPKKTAGQRAIMSNPEPGLMVYDPDLEKFYYHNDTSWIKQSANTLDEAYDQRGPGWGRTINANAGAVKIKSGTGLFGLHMNGFDIGDGIFVDSVVGAGRIGLKAIIRAGADGLVADLDGAGKGLSITHAGAGIGIFNTHSGSGDNYFSHKPMGLGGNSMAILHEGTDIAVDIANSGDTTSLQVSNSGSGYAGVFGTGPGNTFGVLQLFNGGGGKGIFLDQKAAGAMADVGLHIEQPATEAGILVDHIGTGIGIKAVTELGIAAEFSTFDGVSGDLVTVTLCDPLGIGGAIVSSDSSAAPSLAIDNSGTGNAMMVVSKAALTPPSSFSQIHTTNADLVMNVTHHGEGGAVNFELTKAANGVDALTSKTVGTGSAASFAISNTSNASAAVFSITDGSGPALEGENSGTGTAIIGKKTIGSTGSVASFTNAEVLNGDDAVSITTASGSAYACNIVNSSGADALRVDGSSLHLGPWHIVEPIGDGLWVEGSSHLDGFTKISGDLFVTGTITGSSKSFKIDHPLDPENKDLYHVSIESDEMLNIYTGNAKLDETGAAVVQLPKWFEALNKDFRYSLTCIGGFAQVYIAEEVADNQFRIAGGKAGMKISWQVSGVRKDAHAVERNFQVEVDKVKVKKNH